jgi:hypothetical protein
LRFRSAEYRRGRGSIVWLRHFGRGELHCRSVLWLRIPSQEFASDKTWVSGPTSGTGVLQPHALTVVAHSHLIKLPRLIYGQERVSRCYLS